MSKEQKCKCCQDYWYASNLTNGLCPNCYDYVADLEAKLAQAQKTIEIQKMSNDALQEENLDYRYDITDTAYEQAKEMAKGWEEDYQQEIEELKQQLAENEEYIKYNVPKLIEANKMMSKQLAEKEEQLKSSWYEICPRCGNPYGASQFVRENGEVICSNCMKIEDIYEPLVNQLKQQLAEKNQDKISFAVEQLEKVKEKVLQETERITDEDYLDFEAGFESCYIFMQNQINQQIKQLTHQHEDKGE